MKADKSPLITVITLSYNSPDIFGAIDSVLNQTYDNIEYIILDDGTSDFDIKIIKEYVETNQKGNIKSLIVEKNQKRCGIVKQTNKATALSKGEYIFNLAGDDQFADEKVLSDWVDEFIKTGADYMTAYRDVYDSTLQNFLYRMPNDEELNAIKTFSPQQLFEYVEGYNIVLGCCTARSRKNVEEVGPISERYKLVEDYILLLKILRMGIKVEFFDRVVVKYRDGGICSVHYVNREYWQDSDRIFYKEVLPYSNNKRVAKEKYYRWKDVVLLGKVRQQFQQEKKDKKGNALKIFFLYIRYAFQYPKIARQMLRMKVNSKKRRK